MFCDHIVSGRIWIQSSCKGKAIPLQAWTGPEVSKSLKAQDLKTVDTCRW